MFLPMIDTLYASVDIENYEESTKDLQNILVQKKEEANLAATNQASTPTTIQIGNLNFKILPSGTPGYAYILHNDFFEVKIAKYRSSNQDFFPIFIRIKSECLWCISPEKSWTNIIEWINNYIGSVSSNKISRLDLCCHTDELNIDGKDIGTFKGTFFNEDIRRFRRRITGLNFGSSSSHKIYCRIYDKHLEINQKSKKFWFFMIWKNNKMDIENVWNVEFQLNREFLREYQIETVENAFASLKSLWSYCTKEWLVKVNLDRTRIERCSTNETWIKIQNSFDDFKDKPLVKRENQIISSADSLIPSTIGNITTFASRMGITDIGLIFTLLNNKGSDYLNTKNMTFKEAIKEKMVLVTKESEVLDDGTFGLHS